MILAFDPGFTTGWAAYSPRFDTYKCGELDDDLANLYTFMTKAQPRVVAYEHYTKRVKVSTDELYSPQVIGVIRLWCQQNYIPTFRYLPAEAKAFWKDDKIKKLGLWAPTKDGHAMDAMRVLLTYRTKKDKQWKKEILRTLDDRE